MSTTPLKILCSHSLPENRLNIHPNEGADIGLMMTHYSTQTGDGLPVDIHLLNECPKESVELSTKLWERLGKPKKVVLEIDGGRLRILNA
jgi:hypothetical protein